MKSRIAGVLIILLAAGCGGQGKPGRGAAASAAARQKANDAQAQVLRDYWKSKNRSILHEPALPATLAEARRDFKTVIRIPTSASEPVEEPPADLFRVVHYESPVGKLPAYLTVEPNDSEKHPAIIWITCGDCNTIGDVWSEAPVENDQTAAAYRQAGIVMMFPSLRGGNQNPGVPEAYFGEVDDILAAADFLAAQKFVDPTRIYLGGHSSGGTLVLLVAECSDRFRAVFSFGPTNDVKKYRDVAYGISNDPREQSLRSPGLWLDSIVSPTFVIEGTNRGDDSIYTMANDSSAKKVRFYPVEEADHFNILAPTNKLIAKKILRDTGSMCNLKFTDYEIRKPFIE